MRLLLALLLCLWLAGCPSPKPASAPSEKAPDVSSEAAPSPTPAAEVTETSPAPSPTPAATPAARVGNDYIGTWTTVDDQGQVFDIVIFPNGQVITNWTKGKAGAYGERGLWRKEGPRLIAFYHDGTSDIMETDGESTRYTGHSSGAPLEATPNSTSTARRLSDQEAKFLGVWRLNREPDGTYQYLSLQSNGRAFSSVNGGTEGKWVESNGGAECTWPDGWVDRLELTPDGWQKRSSIGAATNSADAPADISPAVRVGEARFEISP